MRDLFLGQFLLSSLLFASQCGPEVYARFKVLAESGQDLSRTQEQQASRDGLARIFSGGLLSPRMRQQARDAERKAHNRNAVATMGLSDQINALDGASGDALSSRLSQILEAPHAQRAFNQATPGVIVAEQKVSVEQLAQATEELSNLSKSDFALWSQTVEDLGQVELYKEIAKIAGDESYLRTSLDAQKLSRRVAEIGDRNLGKGLNFKLDQEQLLGLQDGLVEPLLKKHGLPAGAIGLNQNAELIFNANVIAKAELEGFSMSDEARRALLGDIERKWNDEIYDVLKYDRDTPQKKHQRLVELWADAFGDSEAAARVASLRSPDSLELTNKEMIGRLTRLANFATDTDKARIESDIAYLRAHPDEKDLTGATYFEDWQQASQPRARHRGSTMVGLKGLSVKGQEGKTGNSATVRRIIEEDLFDSERARSRSYGGVLSADPEDVGIGQNWIRVAKIEQEDSLSTFTLGLTNNGSSRVDREVFWPTDDTPGFDVASGDHVRIARNNVYDNKSGELERSVFEVFAKGEDGKWKPPALYQKLPNGETTRLYRAIDPATGKSEIVPKKCESCHFRNGQWNPVPIQHAGGSPAKGWNAHKNVREQIGAAGTK